jgi:competence protein ComEA
MKTAWILASLLAFQGAALAQTAPDTRADRLRTESVKAEKTPPGKLGAVLDLNTASEKELATLPGIGEVRAKAIVKGRPYRNKRELVQRKIIPESTYKNIESIVIARAR